MRGEGGRGAGGAGARGRRLSHGPRLINGALRANRAQRENALRANMRTRNIRAASPPRDKIAIDGHC